MIKVQPGTILTGDLVTKIIKKFYQVYLPRLVLLEAYYNVENKIKSRSLPSDKPNNRIAHGFAKYITNMSTGFFMGEGMRIDVEDPEYKKHLYDVLEQNNMHDLHFEISKEMSKKGQSYELLYMNESSEICSRKFNGEEIIPVYSTSVSEFLEFAIRLWQEEDLLTEKTIYYAEVYTKAEIITYRKNRDDKYAEIDRKPHHFSDVPVIVYWNNEEQKGDYEDIITLIDAYDKAQSDTANDFEYFTDAYLVLIGAGGGLTKVDGDSEDDSDAIRTLKQERVLLLDEKGQAQWLIKEINDTAVENFKNRVYDDIFFLSQVPALTDESFAGNLSGVSIRYKLLGLEQLAAIKENKFLAAYKKKIRLITQQLNLKYNRNYNPNTVQIFFDRNVTDNLKELAEIAALLDGVISKETQLSLLPFVKDKKEELKRVLEDKLREMDYDELGNIDEDKVEAYVQGT